VTLRARLRGTATAPMSTRKPTSADNPLDFLGTRAISVANKRTLGQSLEQLGVVTVPVIAVAGDIVRHVVGDVAWGMAKDIPKRRAAILVIHRAFDQEAVAQPHLTRGGKPVPTQPRSARSTRGLCRRSRRAAREAGRAERKGEISPDQSGHLFLLAPARALGSVQ